MVIKNVVTTGKSRDCPDLNLREVWKSENEQLGLEFLVATTVLEYNMVLVCTVSIIIISGI